MRFSLWPTSQQRWDELRDEVAHAASTGWDGAYVADHFMPAVEPLDRPMLECFGVLAGLATTVPGIRLGSLVAGNTYRHPAVLANAAATVDQLSGGRLVLGLGAGWQENEHAAYGIELPAAGERLERLAEACAVLRLLFDEPVASFAGRHYTLVDARCDPKPVQPHLPLLVGGGGERVTLAIAARFADEWNVWGTPEVLRSKGAVLDAHCERVDRDPRSVARSAQVLVDIDGASPVHELRVPAASGSVAQLQELIGEYVAAGVAEFVLPDWNLGTGGRRLDAIDRFLAEVASPFRGDR